MFRQPKCNDLDGFSKYQQIFIVVKAIFCVCALFLFSLLWCLDSFGKVRLIYHEKKPSKLLHFKHAMIYANIYVHWTDFYQQKADLFQHSYRNTILRKRQEISICVTLGTNTSNKMLHTSMILQSSLQYLVT